MYCTNSDFDVAKTAKSLLKHWHGLFTFLEREGVEPTNNAAERGIRPAVQWRKICFGNQSEEGELLTARLLTAERSFIRQGRNAFLTFQVRDMGRMSNARNHGSVEEIEALCR
jgi:transposase